MPKKSPKPLQPATETESVQTLAPAKKAAAPSVRKADPLPPDAIKRRDKFYEDSREIEGHIWRSIHG